MALVVEGIRGAAGHHDLRDAGRWGCGAVRAPEAAPARRQDVIERRLGGFLLDVIAGGLGFAVDGQAAGRGDVAHDLGVLDLVEVLVGGHKAFHASAEVTNATRMISRVGEGFLNRHHFARQGMNGLRGGGNLSAQPLARGLKDDIAVGIDHDGVAAPLDPEEVGGAG